MDEFYILDDGIGDIKLIDTRGMASGTNFIAHKQEKLPTKITGTYDEDYNILYIDDVIRKTLKQEKYDKLENLQKQLFYRQSLLENPQKAGAKKIINDSIELLKRQINDIKTGERLKIYHSRVDNILSEYKKYRGKVKTVIFDNDTNEPTQQTIDNDVLNRLGLIEKYLQIASDYIEVNIIRNTQKSEDICNGCGASMVDVATNEDGTQRCPICQTEHNVIIMVKLAKDGVRINSSSSTDDESVENFKKALTRYQGLQSDVPDESIYDELDAYFKLHGCPTGAHIRQLPLNEHGRRGDTNHRMLWDALSKIGRSEHYEDTNYIGHRYWGWVLPDVQGLQERIIDKYHKTQKEYFKIPPEIRDRTSSLGTQYRLWRLLQLENHDRPRGEFRIAENQESFRTHDRLWKIMCDNCPDDDIYYIEC